MPIPKGRPRLGRGGVFTPGRTKAFENQVHWLMRLHYKLAPISGPVQMKLVFAMKQPKKVKTKYPIGHIGDVDNFAKAICDAANGILFLDDCQIVDLHCFKIYSTGEPHIAIEFQEISE